MIKNLWVELKEVQKVLDGHIFTKWDLKQSEVIEKEILALLVELGECAQEWRGFKYWSNNQESKKIKKCDNCINGNLKIKISKTTKEKPLNFDENVLRPNIDLEFIDCEKCNGKGYTNPLLEELIDVIHFTLSIENYYEFESAGYGAIKEATVEGQFKALFSYISGLETDINTHDVTLTLIRAGVIGLIEMLGFTTDQIEQAYYDKNKENFERQERGY